MTHEEVMKKIGEILDNTYSEEQKDEETERLKTEIIETSKLIARSAEKERWREVYGLVYRLIISTNCAVLRKIAKTGENDNGVDVSEEYTEKEE